MQENLMQKYKILYTKNNTFSLESLIEESTRCNYLVLDEIQNQSFIVQTPTYCYGPFLWNEEFNPNKILESSVVKELTEELSSEQYAFGKTTFYLHYKNNIFSVLNSNNECIIEKPINKSEYVFFIDSRIQLNKLLTSGKKSEFDSLCNFIIDQLINTLNLHMFFELKNQNYLFFLSKALLFFPFELLNKNLIQNSKSLIIFSYPELNQKLKQRVNKLSYLDITSNADQKSIVFCYSDQKKNSLFDCDNNNLDLSYLSSVQNLFSSLSSYKHAVLSCHGYKKKDFCTIRLGNSFINPLYFNTIPTVSNFISFFSCLIDYYPSTQNLLYILFLKNMETALHCPYILPETIADNLLKEYLSICLIQQNPISIFKHLLRNQSFSYLFRLSTKLA